MTGWLLLVAGVSAALFLTVNTVTISYLRRTGRQPRWYEASGALEGAAGGVACAATVMAVARLVIGWAT